MGKGKTNTKLFVKAKDWKEIYGGAKRVSEHSEFRPLPFYCCALSFQPFEDPVMTPSGHVFDIVNLVPFVRKHGKDPMSGEPMTLKQMIRLTFTKSKVGKYICPITYKEFTDFSHIVVIRTSGNVYSWDAVKRLNIEAKSWEDLISGEPFKRSDILTLQDPADPSRRNVAQAHWMKEGLNPTLSKAAPSSAVKASSEGMARVLAQVRASQAEEGDDASKGKKKRKKKKKGGKDNSTSEVQAMSGSKRRDRPVDTGSNGASPSDAAAAKARAEARARSFAAPGFTVSGFTARKEPAVLVKPKETRKKGYVRLYTTHGTLNLELHCDLAPVACENFIGLCGSGYYKGVKFHRLIKGFMIQGGDPTGTGTGGKSVWGHPFQDEFHDKASHSKRGILSMANSGPGTNASQFFVTFQAKRHLDGKHTVFGHVVGGMETLDAMEAVPVGGKKEPLLDVAILDTTVFQNPFEAEALEAEEQERLAEAKEKARKDEAEKTMGQWYSNPTMAQPLAHGTGVGKYIAPMHAQKGAGSTSSVSGISLRGLASIPSSKARSSKKKAKTGDFGANW